jgi:hypothetical protein
MAARIANEAGQCELIEPHECGSHEATRRLSPRTNKIAAAIGKGLWVFVGMQTTLRQAIGFHMFRLHQTKGS